MKVFFVASEAMPYAKTGGLGDVTGSLPAALHMLGADTFLILPFYRTIMAKNLPLEQVMTRTLAMGGRALPYTVLRHQQTYFIAQNEFFERDGLYNTHEGDYPDNWMRFAFFARAALETIVALGGADVIHVHDWQAALLPVYLSVLYPKRREKTLLTIHNIAYQGLFSPEILPDIGLPSSVFTVHGLEFYGNVNYLKGGIVWADEVNTVSPTYAREIQTDEYSFGLHGILATRREHLSGILNGIDCSYWDPSADGALPHMYSPSSLAGKVQDKESLLQETGLAAEPDRPLFVMVSRLVAQKGVDLLLGAFDQMMSLPISLMVLGTGDTEIETALVAKAAAYPGRFVLSRKFDEGLAHRMYAGSDFFLMPSRFEPCGLSQMIALRYGSVPVVRRTGGLKDTIQDVHPKTGTGNGISFDDATPSEFLDAVRRAVRLYANGDAFRRIQAIGMACDFSWQASAREYLALYHSMEAPS
ncbi:glycogen synthase GlgA [Candidatus Cryosericum septentrionale]|uniref:Glycogen synthase n=1 Tax=Candidatus Cryosericum septentrionale TaxID=2290913 RepID=A0A398DUZ5_9BACT|nr:glycogen synthase GlgA [Candidatus Cryosericum septentrionale]RIE15928.1 glycogen synthase GlgA [Candidatus Cryosericum septentrionale]